MVLGWLGLDITARNYKAGFREISPSRCSFALSDVASCGCHECRVQHLRRVSYLGDQEQCPHGLTATHRADLMCPQIVELGEVGPKQKSHTSTACSCANPTGPCHNKNSWGPACRQCTTTFWTSSKSSVAHGKGCFELFVMLIFQAQGIGKFTHVYIIQSLVWHRVNCFWLWISILTCNALQGAVDSLQVVEFDSRRLPVTEAVVGVKSLMVFCSC